MARRFTIQLLMDLATRIGANPTKLAGTRTNISFLGKGPAKNPLFQNRLAGLENATEANLGKPETLFAAIEDAVGWAKDGKLNSIQTEILGHNLSGIDKILHPPVLPSASVTPIASGIEALRRFPKKTHKFFGRPLKDKDFGEIKDLNMARLEKGVDDLGRKWGWKYNTKSKLPETGPERYNRLTGLRKQGPEVFNKALNQKTGMSRSISRQLLLQDTRLNLKPEELFMLKEGKGEPLDLMKKYYGRSIVNFDEWMDNILSRRVAGANASELADLALKEIELLPQFASGGLARILEL